MIARVVLSGWLIVAAAGVAAGQTFEVATVKPSDPASTMGIRKLPGGRFVTSNTSLRLLITWAYNITDERLVGAPGWLDSARFDVDAKSPVEKPTQDQLYSMVQALLAERFKLQVHHETRELPNYALEMDPGGPKVKVHDEGAAVSQDPFQMNVLGRLSGTAVTAPMLAKVLSGQLGHYVEDKTGFQRVFDFTLVWRPDGAAPEDTPADGDMRASIFTAIREQLGFRLVPGKSAVDVIAIDHVERKPTEN
jgi:uncharacterized protein (TIGR03435 family)